MSHDKKHRDKNKDKNEYKKVLWILRTFSFFLILILLIIWLTPYYFRVLTEYNGTAELKKNMINFLHLNNTYQNIRFCNSKIDCVAVSCSCYCSGCGGFPYQDIVNKQYEDLWYKTHNCTRPRICLQVCCPKRYIECINHNCKVIEGAIK